MMPLPGLYRLVRHVCGARQNLTTALQRSSCKDLIIACCLRLIFVPSGYHSACLQWRVCLEVGVHCQSLEYDGACFAFTLVISAMLMSCSGKQEELHLHIGSHFGWLAIA